MRGWGIINGGVIDYNDLFTFFFKALEIEPKDEIINENLEIIVNTLKSTDDESVESRQGKVNYKERILTV